MLAKHTTPREPDTAITAPSARVIERTRSTIPANAIEAACSLLVVPFSGSGIPCSVFTPCTFGPSTRPEGNHFAARWTAMDGDQRLPKYYCWTKPAVNHRNVMLGRGGAQ